MIARGSVNMNFGDEEEYCEKEIIISQLNSTNLNTVTFIPQENDFHDLDDFSAENILIKVKKLGRNSMIIEAEAPDGASGIYKFNYIINYGD